LGRESKTKSSNGEKVEAAAGFFRNAQTRPTERQRLAAQRNVKKAARAAKSKRSIASMPAATQCARQASGSRGTKAGTSGSSPWRAE